MTRASTAGQAEHLDARGLLAGTTAYGLWGLLALYWPLLEPAGPVEILAHRIVWALPFVALLLLVVRRPWGWLAELRRDRRRLRVLAAAACFVCANWGVYIWTVNSAHVLDASLGYYITPLCNVALGAVVLGERLDRYRWAAVVLSAAGVLWLVIGYGQVPWGGLLLAATFSMYGLMKNRARIGSLEGLFVETAVLVVPALLTLSVIAVAGDPAFGASPGNVMLFAGSGVITAVPLLFFATAAARIPLYALGLLQYLTPTLQFAIGLHNQEEMVPSRLIGFALVWAGLLLFIGRILLDQRRPTPGSAVRGRRSRSG